MRRLALSATICSGFLSTGCATVGPVAAPMMTSTAFSYSAGRASQDFLYPPSAIQSAITGALDDLRVHSVHLTNDAGLLVYHGSTADDRRISVTIRPLQANSRVAVRVGWFGDEPLSKAVLDRIGIRLGELPAEAVPVEIPSEPGSNPFFAKDPETETQILKEQADSLYRDTPVP